MIVVYKEIFEVIDMRKRFVKGEKTIWQLKKRKLQFSTDEQTLKRPTENAFKYIWQSKICFSAIPTDESVRTDVIANIKPLKKDILAVEFSEKVKND